MSKRRALLYFPLAGLALVAAGGLAVANAPLPDGRPAVGAVEAAGSTNASVVQAALIQATERVGPAVVSVKTDRGIGSGVIYDAAGNVLTNAHVVDGARTIHVDLADGRRFSAKVLGADSGFDLAVLKISGDRLPVAPLGSSGGLKPGQFVVAIGNPYGFDHTVTVGVVSALNRPIAGGQGSHNQPMIQTDTAINPGNSGGPLVDLDGNVVGINTLVAAPQGVPAQGLGFAVPVDTVKRIAPQLAKDGHVSRSGRPYLGFSLADVEATPRTARSARTASRPEGGPEYGARVAQVLTGSPADRAGIAVDDVIVGFEGRDIYSSDGLLQELVLRQPGDRVQLTIQRAGETRTREITVTLGEAPAGPTR